MASAPDHHSTAPVTNGVGKPSSAARALREVATLKEKMNTREQHAVMRRKNAALLMSRLNTTQLTNAESNEAEIVAMSTE
jgi:hypothetical protein